MPQTTADVLQVARLATLVTSLFRGSNDFCESPQNRLAAGPATERLYAGTARENAAILRADEELGFAPVSTHPGWQKRIGKGSDGPRFGDAPPSRVF